METQNLKTEVLLELIFCVDINLDENDILKSVIPLYLRKLNCFMSSVHKFEKDNTLTEEYLIPFTFKNEKTWEQLNEVLKNIYENRTFYEVSIENKYYYFYPLNEYGYLILGKYNPFEKILKNELVFVANFLGKILRQSYVEKLRKNSEEKLANERKLLRTIIDNIPINIYTKDLEYRKTLINRAELNHLKKTNEEDVIGKSDFDLYDDEVALNTNIEDKQVLDEGKAIINEEKHIGDGRWAYISKLPIKDVQGNILGLVGMSYDITERKEEQDQLSFLFQILDNLADSVRVTDEAGRIVYLNKSTCRNLDINQEDAQNYYIWEISTLIKDKENWQRFLTELYTKKTNFFVTKSINRKLGLEFPVELSVTLLNIRDKQYVLSVARDISKRKAAEKALRESEEFKASLISSINDIVFVINNELCFVEYHEPDKKELFRLPEDFLNKSLDTIKIPKEAKNTIRETLVECINDKFSKGEFRVKSEHDEQWYEITSTQFKDPNGEKKGYTCTVRNITERIISNKIIKQQLSLQEILIKISSVYINADLETVGDIIQNSLKDIGEFVGCNRVYIYEYNFKENVATNTFEWCNESEICRLSTKKIALVTLTEQIIKHAKGKEYQIHETKTAEINQQNSLSIHSLTIPMLQNGNLVGYVGFDFAGKIHHYTQKEKDLLFVFSQMLVNVWVRQSQDALLKLQEQKYRNIISNMKLGLLEIGYDERIIFANETFCQMTGYSLEDIIGKNAPQTLLFTEDYGIQSRIKQSRINGEADSYELCIKNKNGERNWWYISGAPNYNDKKELTGSIGVFLDISEQKKMKADLEEALSKAEIASHAKELFLANMSHEIRTPLNVITGMIRELGKENLTDKQRSYVRYSENAADHLLAIINNILDISKIEAGEYELIYKEFSVSAMVANVKSILFSRIKDKNLDFILEISENIKPALIGDVSRMRQILINLINNAIKFTEKGFIKLKVSLQNETATSQHLLFEVEDSGVGIDKDFLSKLFDKFSQEMNENNRKFEGTGLGMSITKELIKLMGGKIDVESQKGIGTRIFFSIEMTIGDESKLVSNKPHKYANSLIGTKVLLVEDNEMNRFIAVQSLKYVGCAVTEAFNGKDAVEKVKSVGFDIILMDIQMPGMDGVEATKIIRNQLNNTTPIIALTANTFKHDIDNYISAGMNNYLIKPYLEADLFNTIEKYTANLRSSIKEKNEATDEQVTLYNTAYLREVGKDNPVFVSQMLKLFIELAEQTSLNITESLKLGDSAKVKQLAHKIKPSIDNMMIDILKEDIRQLEGFDVNVFSQTKFEELALFVRNTLKKVIEQIKEKEKI